VLVQQQQKRALGLVVGEGLYEGKGASEKIKFCIAGVARCLMMGVFTDKKGLEVYTYQLIFQLPVVLPI